MRPSPWSFARVPRPSETNYASASEGKDANETCGLHLCGNRERGARLRTPGGAREAAPSWTSSAVGFCANATALWRLSCALPTARSRSPACGFLPGLRVRSCRGEVCRAFSAASRCGRFFALLCRIVPFHSSRNSKWLGDTHSMSASAAAVTFSSRSPADCG